MLERPDLLREPRFRSSPDAYRQCAFGLLDTNDDPEIRFDVAGVSHYYYDYRAEEDMRVGPPEQQEACLAMVLAQIKAARKNRKYDTIVGLSGGVDSTYIAHLAKEYGLNPLCVHFDNGWNSELAVKNIENIVSRLGFDLFTYVIDWNEFKDLQLAYLRASVIDIEVVTDHAIFATLYRLARKHGIRHILSGTNVVTESVLPRHWNYNKADHVNIRAIHREFGTRPLKTFPFMDLRVKKLYQMVYGVHSVSLLDLVPYHKAEVKKLIVENLGWRDYVVMDSLAMQCGKLLGLGTDWLVLEVKLSEEKNQVVIRLEPRSGAQNVCPKCGQLAPLKDHAFERNWKHLDTMQFEAILKARPARVNCPECGVHTASQQTPQRGLTVPSNPLNPLRKALEILKITDPGFCSSSENWFCSLTLATKLSRGPVC